MNRLEVNGAREPVIARLEPGEKRGFTQVTSSMDIARPDIARRKFRRRLLLGLGATAALGGITAWLMLLEPAVPRVDKGITYFGKVQRGDMKREVRGNGTLVPELIQFVQADTGGEVVRIHIQPGAEVAPDTVVLELSNPELTQAAFDAEFLLKASEAQLARLKVQIESDRLSQQSTLASLRADATQAAIEAEADEILARDGLTPTILQKKSRAKADDLAARVEIEKKRLDFGIESAKSQLAVQEAELEKLRAQLELKRQQVAHLKVRAGIQGVLTQIGDREPLQAGQRVAQNAMLAKIVVPTQLKAEIRVPETQARDVARGQTVEVDTRNGFVPGHVVRIDPASQNGSVLVEVKLDATPPRGSRPDLAVEAKILLDHLKDVLFVSRGVDAQEEQTVGLFKVIDGGRYAVRVPVKIGRISVNEIEVREGLQAGDEIILSSMNQWDGHNKVRLD